MRSSPAERFARRLAQEIERIAGAEGWTLRLDTERDWASATLEGCRARLTLFFPDGHIPPDLPFRLEALDLDIPSYFLGDLVTQPLEGGLTIKVLLLKV